MADEVSSTPNAQSSPVKSPALAPDQAENANEKMQNPRAEIDTSAPFESVKEAATRFGGMGFWKPSSFLKLSDSEPTQQDDDESISVTKMEEQTILLEKNLMEKERETLDVLKELESTKNVLEELKLKLQEEIHSIGIENENRNNPPEFILLELKQAKLNLSRTTTDLAEIRTSVETYNKLIANEKIALEKTRDRLIANSNRMKSLDEELSRNNCLSNVYKKTGEAARTDIEQTKAKIKTAKIKLVAAKKMKEAARAAEAVAIAEMKAISATSEVTLSYDEYLSLTSKARETEEASRKRVADAMIVLENESFSQMEILKRVEEATEEVKFSKRVLEEALSRVEAANIAKFDVEESLKKWRSKNFSDVNDMNLRPTLSIGQILSRKLLLKEEYEKGCVKKKKVSLGQILCKPANDNNGMKKQQQIPSKRKKVSQFARFSVLVSNQNKTKKKKKTTSS